jgi:uncharacterized protein YegP (UPF0339 family)
MRYDPQKSFGYPVLRTGNDDYIRATIQANFELALKKNSPIANVEFIVIQSVPEIAQAIKNGDAVVVTTAICSKTSTIFKNIGNALQGTFQIDINQFAGEVIFDACIVVAAPKMTLTSEKINPEFGTEPFELYRGSVLAQAHPTYRSFSREMQKSMGNLFELDLDETQREGEWRLDLSNDKVKIIAPSELYNHMLAWKNSLQGQQILLNSVLMPAMVEMIESIRHEDSYMGYRWATALEHRISDFKDLDLQNSNSTLIAQRIWGSPTMSMSRFMEK